MSEVHTETTQYEVNLPKPRPRKVLLGVAAAIAIVALVAFAAAAILNRSAQSQAEATARVMPADTMIYVSLNIHTDQLPNFNVIADAWKDSKEARQVASGLQLGLTQAGLNWEEDIAPWLGDRAAFGLIDLGGKDDTGDSAFAYRAPAFVVAIHIRDRAASDKFLANFRAAREKDIQPNGFFTTTIADDAYRGIPLVYVTTKSSLDSSDARSTRTQENLAYATVNDVIVLAQNRATLQKAIDAALDGKSLAASANYQTVMNALPGQNAGALYLDYTGYMNALLKQMPASSLETGEVFDNIYTGVYSNPQSTPSPDILKDILKRQEENKRRREEARRRQEEQLAQAREMLQSIGGMGVAMSYEPSGIRFDMAAQQDLSKLPEKWRNLQTAMQTPVSNQVFNAIPANAILAANVGVNGGLWDMLLDPDYLAMTLASVPGATKDEITTKLAAFQKLIGVDLKTDLLGLFNGEAGFVMLPQAEQQRSEIGDSLPFQFAALLDSSDAAKAVGSLDKIAQGASALDKNGPQWQGLSGLPYSVLLDSKGKPMFTYGVVDGRVVVGTNSDTLLAIDNADQAPLANSETFKQATALLPGNRLNTFYMQFQSLWDLFGQRVGQDCQPCNYLKHFAWMSAGSEVPVNGLSRGSLHIGISK